MKNIYHSSVMLYFSLQYNHHCALTYNTHTMLYDHPSDSYSKSWGFFWLQSFNPFPPHIHAHAHWHFLHSCRFTIVNEYFVQPASFIALIIFSIFCLPFPFDLLFNFFNACMTLHKNEYQVTISCMGILTTLASQSQLEFFFKYFFFL